VNRRQELRAALRVIRYVWGCLLFLGLWFHFSYVRPQITISPGLLYTLYFCGLATIAVQNVLGLRYGGTLIHGIVFNLLAIMFISLGVYTTGKIQSEFWLVYFVFIIADTLALQRGLMLATDGVVALSYAAATWPALATPIDVERLLTRIFFLLIVGAIARAIASNESARNQEVAALREQIAIGEERARIAREIHDGVGHSLTSVILQLELCQRLLRRDPDAAEALVVEQKGLLRHAMDEAREMVFHLRPLELEASGFAACVRRHVQQLSRRAGLSVELSLPEAALPLSPAAELALARVIQEALTNAARHAAARKITVEVRTDRQQVVCLIEDDGQGFDPTAAPAINARGGFGLKGMRERTATLNGHLEIDSAPGRGTRIRVALPAQ
jgi:signal transduction histidine kinase